MILKLSTTLKGKHKGEPAVWREGSIFDDKIEKIPKDILDELKAGTGIVENITPTKPKQKAKAVGEENVSPTVSKEEKKVGPKPKKITVKKKTSKPKKKI